MSVSGMQKTLFVTEIKRMLPDITDDNIRYIMESIKHFEVGAGQVGYFNGFRDGYQQCSYDEDRGDWTDNDDALDVYSNGKASEYAENLHKSG